MEEIIKRLRRLFCRHDWSEKYGDLRADVPGGPRTYHEIYWRCRSCGKLSTKGCAPEFVDALRARSAQEGMTR